MRVLVTGHKGYIGTVLIPMLLDAEHEVTGLDNGLFEDCIFGQQPLNIAELRCDVRDLTPTEMDDDYDAVIHLAALSNDPLGDLNPQWTYDINYLASVRLAQLAKQVGIPRFLFASSCSLYGLTDGNDILTEDAPVNPITLYGKSKVRVEQDVTKLADSKFSPTFLRNATAYGFSPRLRADVVVNNLTGVAFTAGEVLLKSDGTPWRPLVHVEDIGRAFLSVLNAPRELVHNQAFNVGSSRENYQVREIADMVREVVPNSRIRFAEGAGPDPRCYRVDCSKIASTLHDFRPQWTVRRGIEQLYAVFQKYGITATEFESDRYTRVKHLRKLIDQGLLDESLRWRDPAARSSSGSTSAPAAR